MTVRTRFAPSPTGRLHVGNARTALVAWLHARKAGGAFVLRLDDTDAPPEAEAHAEAIFRDLAWLGLDHDRFERQSARVDRHGEAIDRLKAAGRLYPCYETPEELELERRARLSRGLPPIYDRAALDLTEHDRARLEAEGRAPHWRFRLDDAPIEWTDRVRGPVRFAAADLSDPVVVRADGRPLYHLGSVVDDIDLAITDVVRGEDHVANTAAHIQMFQALGAEPPAFAHLPLLVDADGKALSKRLGSLSLEALRDEQGIEPEALVALLARLGTADPVEPIADRQVLIEGFAFERFSRAAPRFDPAELARLNARILHEMPFAVAEHRLADLGLGDVDAAFWAAVRPNLEVLADAADWWRVAKGPVTPAIEEPDFLAEAAEALPAEPFDGETWGAWTAAVKQATGRKGKTLFLPLRRALTGRDRGPELAALLPLIGRERARRRLLGETA
ncbi:MAG: glutamate--tRNA ligase [Azospirillaceae bacterium]